MKKFTVIFYRITHSSVDTQHQSSTQESDGWLRKACEGWKGEKIKKKVEVKGGMGTERVV